MTRYNLTEAEATKVCEELRDIGINDMKIVIRGGSKGYGNRCVKFDFELKGFEVTGAEIHDAKEVTDLKKAIESSK